MDDEHFEKDFFMKNNVMKECSTSFVVYIQDRFAEKWRTVLEKHIEVHRIDKARYIFKTGIITITLYDKPKKDPRSKLLIQSGDQRTNLDFVLDKLPLFYREVVQIQNNLNLEFKSMQRAVCPKCNKLFTTKKGGKQHILRMHSKKDKMSSVVGPVLTLGETTETPALSMEEKSMESLITQVPSLSIITVPEPISQVNSPLQKKLKMDNSLLKPQENSAVVQQIVNEMLDECDKSDVNYQCGDCGKTFQTEKEIYTHIESNHTEPREFKCELCGHSFPTTADVTEHINYDHTEPEGYQGEKCGKVSESNDGPEMPERLNHTEHQKLQCEDNSEKVQTTDNLNIHIREEHIDDYQRGPCKMCDEYKKAESNTRDHISEKDDRIDKLEQHNARLVAKNESLSKENKRLNLALLESIVERNDVKKEMEAQVDVMNEILKKNTLLVEEIRVKEEYINVMDEQEKTRNKSHNTNHDPEDDVHVDVVEPTINTPSKTYAGITKQGLEVYKCNKCDYKTSMKTYMRGHSIAHNEGQYQCLHGCNVAFTTVSGLDEHLKTKHKEPQKPQGYMCIHCSLTFRELFQLRQHMTKKHEVRAQSCENCGLMLKNEKELNHHKQQCLSDFQQVKPPQCKFYLRGSCVKGKFCRFAHPSNENSNLTAPHCRNGMS